MLNRTLRALSLLAVLSLFGPFAFALGGSDDSSSSRMGQSEDSDYVAGRQAVEATNWTAARDAFNKVVARDPGNANAHNYLGYTYRKSGNLDLAFKHYEEALRLNPRHRGAHEYMGEAYLMANNVAKAEEHLKVLDRLCLFGCEEYEELKKAVAEYRHKAANK